MSATGTGIAQASATLREDVLAANLALPAQGLVKLTSGNVSAIDRERGLVAIKPSGVAYADMTAQDIVVLELDGTVVFGGKPSTDTPTHLALYAAFSEVGGIVHTHSTYATAWAQAAREIPVLGTTHADLTARAIPVTRELTPEEVAAGYEAATGEVLFETVGAAGPLEIPAVLLRGHAPFCWGTSATAAVQNAVWLEEIARIALLTSVLDPAAPTLPDFLRDKHFGRKHGPGAYYGQS